MNIYGNKGILSVAMAAILVMMGVASAKGQDVPQIHRDLHKELQAHQDEVQSFRALIDSLISETDEEVFDLFPALDLYGSWDDNSVNPLLGKSNIKIPDEQDIDISTFVAPTVGRITSKYGWRRRRMHRGIDLKLYVGDTVRAAFDGQVRIKKFNRRGYGYYYVIRHPNGLETVYGHLSKFIVDKDEYVKAGQPIGLGGNTGRSTGSHLHFETRFMGIDLDPATLIDFETFKPKSNVYHFVHKKAKSVSSGNSSGDGVVAYHKVKQGDTLGAIARRYGTTVSRLCKLNGIKASSILRLGQRIRYK